VLGDGILITYFHGCIRFAREEMTQNDYKLEDGRKNELWTNRVKPGQNAETKFIQVTVEKNYKHTG
jgi:hypothetical protein